MTLHILMNLLKFEKVNEDSTSEICGDIKVVFISPISCRLVQPTDGSIAYIIQQDANRNERSRYDPSATVWSETIQSAN